jgi:Pentapeptide repeats (9 copies)
VSSAGFRRIQSAVKRIGYVNLAKSWAASEELESLLARDSSPEARQAVIVGLGEVILTLPDAGENGVSWPVRELRNSVLSLLKQAAEGRLCQCFKETDLEGLDLYGMDFAGADLTGLSLRRGFLVGSVFRESSLAEASFAGASIRNVDFKNADLAGVDFTDADWFNASGLTEEQLVAARRETLRPCPEDLGPMHDYLLARYRFPFESWSGAVQEQLQSAWAQYLCPGGLAGIVARWRTNPG